MEKLERSATPQETETPPDQDQEHTPALWRRFWARSFDLSWQVVALSFLLGLLLAILAPEQMMMKLVFAFDSRQSLLNPWFYFFIPLVPVALLLDALMLRFFGNTPGKALLGLHVVHAQGRPKLGQYLRRNVGLWVRGLGLSIPIVSLIAMYQQFMHVKDLKDTHYDLKTGFSVSAKPLPLWRKLLFVVLMGCMYGLNFLPAMTQPLPRNMTPLYWKNPETGFSALLPGYWQIEPRPHEAGGGHFFHGPFTSVLFMPEQVKEPQPFEDFVFNVILRSAEAMELKQGRYSDYKGLPLWRTEGRLVNENVRIEVQIIQSGNTLWHVLAFQRPPYHPNPADVEQIQTRLLDTLPRNLPSTYSQKYP